MSKGLMDYAEKNPCNDAGGVAYAVPIRDVIEDERRAAELMQEIGDKIRQAAPASNVLEDAFSLIGILAQNEAWADDQKRLASEIYGVEKIDGLLPMPEEERLREKRRLLQEKTIRSLTRSANACAALEKELRAAIRTAGGVAESPETWGDVGEEDIPY